MKTPQFWHQNNLKSKLISWVLLPISWLYLLGHLLDFYYQKPKKTACNVICIGNLVAGGAGKTPVALAIGKILQNLAINFSYLSGGYGGKIKDFTLVNSQIHNSTQVGDEPLLLAQTAKTFITKDRFLGCKQIVEIIPIKSHKNLVIIDDGLQSSDIYKNLAIMVIDGNYGFGNGLIIPAGPLREPIKFGIKKADLIVIIGEDKHKIAAKITQEFAGNKKIITAKITPTNQQKFINKSLIAFSGIARPEKFFDSLKLIDTNIISQISYPDHYQYKNKEIEKLLKLSKKKQATLITTKKDWVRLDKIYQKQIEYLDIAVEFDNVDYLKEQLIALFNA